ncbi:DUF1746-domain-containing protein [Terfezia boudieri ATCC MYA-4762]|uniref:DUF1746-domain-containing protein n=1 Tax=Terfezia boudieri ATCC MYA-4762 TaxID=1051890 RepID=A0A3N4M2I1_9PEZI|nr:DUF1746-domain-containing protein [Terfezia boudieri ATCC MYA-4762]
MSYEVSRDPTPRAPSLGGQGPSQSSSANAVRDRQTAPKEALEEEIVDGSRSGTPIPPEAVNRHSDADEVARGLSGQRSRSRSRRRREARVTAAARRAVIAQTKIKFLTDFIRSMDMVVYFYFAYMYFLDNSFFRFFIRCAIQLNFLTPKPINLPTPPQRRSVIIGLFGWTIFNLLIHILGSAPEAGEASGGWLHGGLIIDFIGQEGPISKVRLAITDVTILLLQLVILAATIAKLGLLEGVTEGRRRGGDAEEGIRTHDLDSEERGERRGERQSENAEEFDLEDGNDDDDGIDDLGRGGERRGELDGVSQVRRHHRRRRRRRRWSTRGEDQNGSLFSHSRQRRSTSTSRRTSIGGEQEPGGGGDDDGGRYVQYSGQLVVAGLSIVNAVKWQWSHGSPGSVVRGGEGSDSTTVGRNRAATGASGGGEGVAIRGLGTLVH